MSLLLNLSSRKRQKRSAPITEEHWEQVALFDWAKTVQHPAMLMMFAIPNGGKRHIVTAMKMKDEGVKVGVPDIFMAYPSLGYYGLFIELKSMRGSASEAQKSWIQHLNSQGYRAEICRGAVNAANVIEAYLGLQH